MRRLAATAALLAALAGCSTPVAGTPVAAPGAVAAEQDRVMGYFQSLNTAGEEGEGEQTDFLRRTQHPDYTDRFCDLAGLVLHVDPVRSTLREDPDWRPEESAEPPRGDVFVVAVTITIRRNGSVLGEQIGSQRVVVLDGKAYGFSPCPGQ